MSAHKTETDVTEVKYFVGGQWSLSRSTDHLNIANPATGKIIASVPFCTPEEVEQVVQAAAAAFPVWRDTSVTQRARTMFRYRELLDRNAEELARMVTREHGKTLEEARG